MDDGAADTATRARASGGAPPPGGRPVLARGRAVGAWILGGAGLVAYNWWILALLRPGLMTSPDELFSNLEVTGQPYAGLMQRADVAAGLLLMAAFALAGAGWQRSGRAEWLSMLAFAAAGSLSGLYPEVCADGVSAACRRLEYHFRLPAAQYIHIVAGIAEFAAITFAMFRAAARCGRASGRTARVYRGLRRGALIAYPLLGGAYLTDRLGGVMQAVFFVGFSMMVSAQLSERTSTLRQARGAPDSLPALCAS